MQVGVVAALAAAPAWHFGHAARSMGCADAEWDFMLLAAPMSYGLQLCGS